MSPIGYRTLEINSQSMRMKELCSTTVLSNCTQIILNVAALLCQQDFALGCQYIQLVQVLLNFIKATQTENWKLHLACIEDFLPWCFAYDRQNYGRYLSVYWCDMVNLRAVIHK